MSIVDIVGVIVVLDHLVSAALSVDMTGMQRMLSVATSLAFVPVSLVLGMHVPIVVTTRCGP